MSKIDHEKNENDEACEYQTDKRACHYATLDAALTYTGKLATSKIENEDAPPEVRTTWQGCLNDVNEARQFLKGYEAKNPVDIDLGELAKHPEIFRTLSRAAALYDRKIQHDAYSSSAIVGAFSSFKFNEFIGDVFARLMPTPKAKA